MKHRQGLAAALLFCVMCTPVLMGAAAESEPETQDEETAQVETPPQPALYPIDMRCLFLFAFAVTPPRLLYSARPSVILQAMRA